MSAAAARSLGGRALDLVLFAVPFMAAGLVVFALVWSGPAPYADLARDNGVAAIAFVRPGGGETTTGVAAATDFHRAWSSYVTGGVDEPPRIAELSVTEDEYRHMQDVRRVFDVVKLFVPTSLVVIVLRLRRAHAAGAGPMWRLVRDGAAAAAVIVVALALAAALAFDALFLAFHYLFFPQGNFLFDPRTSNIIRLWPEWYFEGMFMRVGLSYLATAVAVAAVAALRLRGAK